jgi:uncharacterized membrane protein YdjX (TVP38/TMEM64 family)
MSKERTSSQPRIGLWLIGLLVLGGILLGIWQPIGFDELLAWGRQASEMPTVTIAILLVMALLFSFGLPGSFGVWLIAPFQPPLIATVLLVISSVAGALGAYAVSKRLSGNWEPSGFAKRVVGLLDRQGGLFTQTALRVLPGFPHSVINFAGGVLLLPLAVFTISALIGLTIKWAVYSSAIYGVVDAVETGSAIQASTLIPLIVLSTLLLLGTWAKHRVTSGS